MAIKVWIGENIDRRHEQEQMKSFLLAMHAYYDNQPTTVHVLCNFICGGSQIDAAVVKPDAFIPIEFKTAGGPVSGSENGKWKFEDPDTCREIELAGGSHASNPYNQIANARTAIAHKLEVSENVFFRPHECDRIADWRHFVHGLVVLAPDLDDGTEDAIDVDFYAKPWFDCCRMKDSAEVVSKTTTRDGELSNKNILKIISHVLHLEDAEMRDGVPTLAGVADADAESDAAEPVHETSGHSIAPTKVDDLFDTSLGSVLKDVQQSKTKSAPKVSEPSSKPIPDAKVNVAPTVSPKSTTGTVIEDAQVKNLLGDINEFVCEDLPVCVDGKATCYGSSQKDAMPVRVEGNWEYAIVLKCKGDLPRSFNSISTYLKGSKSKPVLIDRYAVWRFPDCPPEAILPKKPGLHTVGYFPFALAEYIKTIPNTKYRTDALSVSRNRMASKEEVQWYLGTYFPRSFCEAFCIFDYLFGRSGASLKLSEEVTIFDVGIGSGGATYGLVWALRKWFYDSVKVLNIVGVDGNQHALDLCGDLSGVFASLCPAEIRLSTQLQCIGAEGCSAAFGLKADFVIASKAIQEFGSGFGYEQFLALAKTLLKPTGLATILEISSESRRQSMKVHRDAGEMKCVLSNRDFAEAKFHVISSLTEQLMNEDILFGVWASKDSTFGMIEDVDVKTILPHNHKHTTKGENK